MTFVLLLMSAVVDVIIGKRKKNGFESGTSANYIPET